MLIDWFTVAAQAINFLILVWLLKRFLYRPILDAIDTREQRIAKTLADAADTQNQAQQERKLFSQKNSEFEVQRNTLLETATTAAATEHERLLTEARLAADALSLQRQESLQRQQKSLSVELNRESQKEIFAITRQTLSDLADAELEEQIVKVFLAQLQHLDSASKESLSSAISTTSEPLRVRSAFALQSAQQERINNALNDNFATHIKIIFETAPEVISGIELSINGQKLAWSIAQYIDSLEKHVQQLLQPDPLNQPTEGDAQQVEPDSLQPQLTTKKSGHSDE